MKLWLFNLLFGQTLHEIIAEEAEKWTSICIQKAYEMWQEGYITGTCDQFHSQPNADKSHICTATAQMRMKLAMESMIENRHKSQQEDREGR